MSLAIVCMQCDWCVFRDAKIFTQLQESVDSVTYCDIQLRSSACPCSVSIASG